MRRATSILIVIIMLFLASSSSGTFVLVKQEKIINSNQESIDKELYVEPDKELNEEHLRTLENNLNYLKDDKIKTIVQNIIDDIKKDGKATSEDIFSIVKNSDTPINGVYILSKIKTTKKTDESIMCLPFGFWRLFFGTGYISKGGLAIYNSWEYGWNHGWHLTIKGEEVGKGEGYVVGYFGYADFEWAIYPHYSSFEMDGFGVLIFHITY